MLNLGYGNGGKWVVHMGVEIFTVINPSVKLCTYGDDCKVPQLCNKPGNFCRAFKNLHQLFESYRLNSSILDE